MKNVAAVLLVFGLVLLPSPAFASLPDPVRAMIEAAIENGDADAVKTVAALARQTNPDDTAEINAIVAEFNAEQVRLAQAAEAAEVEAIRTAGLLDNWSGKGELGGFRSTGNSSNSGVTASLSLKREGIDWTHNIRARTDYQRNNGVTSRERYSVAYEPNYKISDRLFLFGLAQYERDPFQGFSARYSVSGGLGYQIIDSANLSLSAKAGPAYRITQFTTGENENRIGGLIGLDFDWDITDRLKLTHDTNAVAETGGSATVIIDSSNTSVDLVTGLNAKISDSLTARLSYTIEYDTNPPEGSVGTDTQSRATLIYGF